MENKHDLVTALKDILGQWELFLESRSEADLVRTPPGQAWAISDHIAHLAGWQQVSVARVEAAGLGREPFFPGWLGGGDPEEEENLEAYNGRIFRENHDRDWADVHRDWREQFERIIRLSEAMPDEDLLGKGRYAWLGEYALSDVLHGTYNHHVEHLEEVLAWFGGM